MKVLAIERTSCHRVSYARSTALSAQILLTTIVSFVTVLYSPVNELLRGNFCSYSRSYPLSISPRSPHRVGHRLPISPAIHGRFEILSLTESFAIFENGDMRSRTGGLSVSLAGPDGRVIGGGIAGFLIAASPIQMVVGSFIPNGYKAHKRKHYYDPRMASVVPDALKMGTAVRSPILQAAPGGNISPTPISQLPIQGPGQTDKSTSDKQNLNVPSTDSADWNGSEPMSDRRSSPDINLCVPVEH